MRGTTVGKRLAPILIAATTLVGAASGSGVAGAGPGQQGLGDTGQAAQPYVPASGPGCSLRRSAGANPHDEWASCIAVTAKLDRAPALGETAKLTVRVAVDPHASAQLGDSDIRVELPPELAWAQLPAGFGVESVRSGQPERSGILSVARAGRRLRAGGSADLSGVVRAVRAGATQIQVRATAVDEVGAQLGEEDVFLTVGQPGKASALGQPVTTGDAAVAVAPATGRAPRPSWLTPRSASTTGLPGPTGGEKSIAGVAPQGGADSSSGTTALCDTRATGNWGYADQNGVWHNSMNFQVQVWDDDTSSPDDLLAVGLTDYLGNYNLCFDANSDDVTEGGTADIYVRFLSEVGEWKVLNGGSPISFASATVGDVTAGSVTDFGPLTAGDSGLQRGLHAYDEANDAWLFIPKTTNTCFDQKDSACRQLKVNWGPTSTDGTYYSTAANDVHLSANDPNSAITVVHEIAHAVMDDVYNDAFPAAPACNPHSVSGTSSAGCAWTEGWAEWFPATVYNDPYFRWPSGSSLDLENASWHNGWGEGDTTEGRIAGALIDITDRTDENYWDAYGETYTNLWYTFTHHVSNTLAEFWASRTADGFNVAETGGLTDLYQNTVDYGFKPALKDNATLTRPTPWQGHNYTYTTKWIYWSVVAVRPMPANDVNLQLYGDRAQSRLLAGSSMGTGLVDFIAVDSNFRDLGDHFPRVTQYAGTGTYDLQVAQGMSVLDLPPETFNVAPTTVVKVEDTWLDAGVPVTISATPGPYMDVDLSLMGDDPDNPATWVRSRSAAVASAGSGGRGVAETLTYTPTMEGWYGVVVTNKGGSGSLVLSRN